MATGLVPHRGEEIARETKLETSFFMTWLRHAAFFPLSLTRSIETQSFDGAMDREADAFLAEAKYHAERDAAIPRPPVEKRYSAITESETAGYSLDTRAYYRGASIVRTTYSV